MLSTSIPLTAAAQRIYNPSCHALREIICNLLAPIVSFAEFGPRDYAQMHLVRPIGEAESSSASIDVRKWSIGAYAHCAKDLNGPISYLCQH
jgi:hypothetical protein